MHGPFIDALGGLSAVADLLRIKDRRVVWNWRERGIPWRFRHRLSIIATDRGIPLPVDFMNPEASAKETNASHESAA